MGSLTENVNVKILKSAPVSLQSRKYTSQIGKLDFIKG